MKRIQSRLVMVLLALATTALNAAVPRVMPYQGRLMSPAGQSVPDGPYLIRFVIYDSPIGGSVLWDNNFRTVNLANGLFSYSLGDSTPLPVSLFDADTGRYLGTRVGTDPEMTPRVKLSSVSYAYKALTADTSHFAQTIADNSVTGTKIQNSTIQFVDIANNGAIPGQVMKWNGSAWVADNDQTGGASGWVDDAAVVRLQNSLDSVGIGTASPGSKLDVVGSIRASDSVFATVLQIGSAIANGELNIFRNGSTAPVVSAFPDPNGAILDLCDETGAFTHSIKADADGAGGSLSVFSNWPSGNGFWVDGNYAGTGNPRVNITGTTSSAIFDMSTTGNASVVLPANSISASEINDEPGITSNYNSSLITLNTTAMQDLTTVTLTIPSAGYIVLQGKCNGNISGTTGINMGIIQIDEFSGGGPFGTTGTSAIFGSMAAPNTSTIYFPVSTMRVYSKSAGTYTFRVEGAAYGANNAAAVTQTQNAVLIATYFPTSYGGVFTAVSGEEAGNFDKAELIPTTQDPAGGFSSTEALYRVDLRELELRAAKARAEAEQAEQELAKARMENSTEGRR